MLKLYYSYNTSSALKFLGIVYPWIHQELLHCNGLLPAVYSPLDAGMQKARFYCLFAFVFNSLPVAKTDTFYYGTSWVLCIVSAACEQAQE